MPWYIYAVSGVLFLFFLLAGKSSVEAPNKLVQPVFEMGPLRMDWRDIIALAVVGISIWALWTRQLTVKEVLTILAGILVGKIFGK